MAFRFSSISAVIKGSIDTLKRFPLPFLSAIVGSLISIYMIGMKWDVQKNFEHLWKIVMCCWLGMNLFLSMSLISERRKDGAALKYLIQALGVLMLIGYYFLLPEFKKMTATDGMRFALFAIGLHLLVSFSPFVAKGETNGFWQFNKTLFLRFLLSALYSGVFYIGLALALVAIDQLFNVKIADERYGQLWVFLAGIFNTWFFLAGIPENIDELESITDYPKGLKIFTQFVLLPLVTVYLLILYAYGIKIIIQWELPKGWVSYLVNAFSVFGILSLLLIYPIRNEEGNTWMKIFSRWFYRALFPLIVLLGVAIGKRVIQYGITENRYFVLIVALWLAGIAAYFLLSKTKNIKLIPVSLCLIAFLSSFGPWSAFSVSEKSQVYRLEKLLTEEKILIDGKIEKATNTVSEKNGRQIVSIIRYMDDYHGFDEIKLWFKEDIDTVFAQKDSSDYVNNVKKILTLIGVEDNDYYNVEDLEYEDDTITEKGFSYYEENNEQQAVPLEGFDYFYAFNQNFYTGSDYRDNAPEPHPYHIYFGNDSGLVKYSIETKEFSFFKNGKENLQFNFNEFLKKIREYSKGHKRAGIPHNMMLFEARNDSVKMRLYVTNISGTISKEEVNITNVSGLLFFKFSPSLQSDTTHASITKY